MTTIILLNGKGGSGKDTLCKYLCYSDNTIKALKLSSIEPVKELARKELDWSDDMKDSTSRKMLSIIKDFIWMNSREKINDYLYEKCSNGIKENYDVIFIDIREPEQLDYYKKYLAIKLNVPVKTLLITRAETSNIVYNNHADDCVNDYKYDYTFENKTSKTEPEFKKLMDSFIKLIKTIMNPKPSVERLQVEIVMLKNVCTTLLDLAEQLSKYANTYSDKMYIQNTIIECKKVINTAY